MPDLLNPASRLSHDDFRRAHNHFRGAHFNHRRANDDCVMMFISRMPAPIASGKNAAGGGKKGCNAGQIQDFFHAVTLRDRGDSPYKV